MPGFQFIQDPIEYSSRTHHSNEDVYDRAQADDLKQASTIMAAFLWNAANMEERFPRKPMDDANSCAARTLITRSISISPADCGCAARRSSPRPAPR